MGKFIVTGASGYIGRYVVEALSEHGQQVVVIVRDSTSVNFSPGVHVVESDLWELNLEDIKLHLEGSTLIHLAWQDGFTHTSDAHMGQLSNHYFFVKSCIEAGVKKVVGLGTMHELGPKTGLVAEDEVANPINQYGIAKNALRLSLEELCEREDVVFLWLRCFYILGDDSRNHSVFSKMLELEAAGARNMPLTLGTTKFDFIEVDELGKVIARVSEFEESKGIINIGSGKVISFREQLEIFHQKNNLTISLEFGAFPERQGISEGCWPDIDRLVSLLRA